MSHDIFAEAERHSDQKLRPVPWSREAEQSVLGALLVDNSAWDRCADLLMRESFFDRNHGRIFDAIGSMVNAGKPADVVTVLERLQADGSDDECGGLVYLNDLANSVPSSRNIRRYAEIVADKALRRAMVKAADEAAALAQGELPAMEALDGISTLFAQVAEGRHRADEPQTMEAVITARIDHYNDLASGNVQPGMATGFDDLDKALNGGLRPGKVYVLAARPGIGKSSLAQTIVLNAARDGNPGMYLSQEMENGELADRAVSNFASISFGKLMDGKLSDAEWGRLSEAVDKLARLPVQLDDAASLTLHDIRLRAITAKRKFGLKILVVDYLQLCASSKTGRRENRNAEIEELSRGLKSLAKQLGLAVIVLSQLNRDVERRASPEPNLADLRDSGAIEQDADVIAFIWREDEQPEYQRIAMSLPKNRQGKPGARIAFEFRGYFQRWTQADFVTTAHRGFSRASAAGFDA